MERYQIEILEADKETRLDHNDLDTAAKQFYALVAEHYEEPSASVYLHDLVASQTLASWNYDEDDDVGQVYYNSNDR